MSGVVLKGHCIGRPSLGTAVAVFLLSASSLAQYQPIQGHGGVMNANTPSQMRLVSAWDSPPAYRRIRIMTRDDIELTYPLLASYVAHPERASSVDEFVVDTYEWPSQRRSYYVNEEDKDRELREPPRPVSDDAHAAVEAYARGLGLGAADTAAMVEALAWKKRHLAGERPESPDGFPQHNAAYASAAAALLLSLCRNLTTLQLGEVTSAGTQRPGPGPDAHPGGVLERFLLDNNYGRLPAQHLAQLRHVQVGPGYTRRRDERNYDRTELLNLLRYVHRLPAVETVDVEAVMEYQAARLLFPPRTSAALRRLRLAHVDVSSGMLGTILRVPHTLEALTISLGGLWHRDGGSPGVSLKTLGKCLLQHRTTLRELDLDVSAALHEGLPVGDGEETEETWDDLIEDFDGDEDEAFSGNRDEYFLLDEQDSDGPLWTQDLPDTRPYGITIGSLHDFEALTHLSISLRALLGTGKSAMPPTRLAVEPPFRLTDALPPHLEALRLYDYRRGDNPDIDDHVWELLEKKAERFPGLTTVEGVETTIPSVDTQYPARSEAALWPRPRMDLDWIEA